MMRSPEYVQEILLVVNVMEGREEKLCNDVRMVQESTYLGAEVSASRGCEVAVTTTT